MDARQQRGLEIAATRTINHKGDLWVVPSQTGKGTYRVHMMPKLAICTCPDFETRGVRCKHIFAVSYAMTREHNADGSTTVTKTLTVTATTERTTYPQNWPAYNAAQTNEKDKFQTLLADLCRGIPQPQERRDGIAQLANLLTRFSARRSRSIPPFRTPLYDRSSRSGNEWFHLQGSPLQFDFQLP